MWSKNHDPGLKYGLENENCRLVLGLGPTLFVLVVCS